MLFDRIERTETRVKRENESTFVYLNSSARSPMTAARQVLEQWFADYPDSGKADLRARFRSPIDSQFKPPSGNSIFTSCSRASGSDSNHTPAYEEDQHDMVRWWFSANLERPTRFTAAKAPFYRKKNRAVSWFKDTAIDHIAQIRELVVILENHGVHVQTLKVKRVGYVVYEDDYQIVAEPFADMKC